MTCSCNLCFAAIIGIIPALYFLRRYFQGGQFKKDNVRIDGKVVVITGCNTGIGKETVLDLAKRGAKVYMACRDLKKCDEARFEIIKATGNNNIFSRKLDLASLESVREFADKFLKEETRLDILINNAGVMNIPQSKTKEGFEMQFGVNHLAHFLLTNLLLDTIKASAPSRIVNVSSSAHYFGRIHKDDLNLDQSFNTWRAYCQSKVANVLFTRELAKRLKGSGVSTNSLHPGAVKTDLQRHNYILSTVLYPLYFFFKTPKSGAQTTLAVALDPDLKDVTGKFFSDCKIKVESKEAQKDELADWLWRTSEKLTALSK